MIAADHHLADLDKTLPRLAELLDPLCIAGLFEEAHPRLGHVEARSHYVRYKPGTNCLVAYEFLTPSGPAIGYAKTVRRDDIDKIAKMVGAGAASFGADLALTLLPNDPKVNALRRFRGDSSALLRRLDQEPAPLRLLSYKPERRFVAVAEANGRPPVVIRSYSNAAFQWAEGRIDVYPSDRWLATPALLGRSRRHASLAIEWVEGSPIAVTLDRDARFDAGIVGRAIHQLHSNGHPGPDAMSSIARRVLASWTAAHYLIDEEPSPDVATEWVDRMETSRSEHTLIHGDLSADQILVAREDGRIGVIDWDRAGDGVPVWDLASLLVDLELRHHDGQLTESQLQTWQSGLIEGYGVLPGRADLFAARAAALAARATEPFRRRRHDWPSRIRATIQRAIDLGAS